LVQVKPFWDAARKWKDFVEEKTAAWQQQKSGGPLYVTKMEDAARTTAAAVATVEELCRCLKEEADLNLANKLCRALTHKEATGLVNRTWRQLRSLVKKPIDDDDVTKFGERFKPMMEDFERHVQKTGAARVSSFEARCMDFATKLRDSAVSTSTPLPPADPPVVTLSFGFSGISELHDHILNFYWQEVVMSLEESTVSFTVTASATTEHNDTKEKRLQVLQNLVSVVEVLKVLADLRKKLGRPPCPVVVE
jgi:hypothetical protein